MTVEFTGITGHVFTNYPIEELAALGYIYSVKENVDYGSVTAKFEFMDSTGEIQFIEFERIEDEEKFKKNSGSLLPIIHLRGKNLNLPDSSKINIHFLEDNTNNYSSKIENKNQGSMGFLCTSLSQNDVSGSSIEFNSTHYFQFKNKVYLLGSYKGPMSDILYYRKESPIWALLIKSNIPNTRNSLVRHSWNGKTVYQLKEAAINFDLFFVPEDFDLQDL